MTKNMLFHCPGAVVVVIPWIDLILVLIVLGQSDSLPEFVRITLSLKYVSLGPLLNLKLYH